MNNIRNVMRLSQSSFQSDLQALINLDGAFSHIPVHIGNKRAEVTFTRPIVNPDGFSLTARITKPDHTTEELPLLESKITEDGFDISFVQDVDLLGNPRRVYFKPTKKEYNGMRNELALFLHKELVHEYNGEKSVRLVRKSFMQ